MKRIPYDTFNTDILYGWSRSWIIGTINSLNQVEAQMLRNGIPIIMVHSLSGIIPVNFKNKPRL